MESASLIMKKEGIKEKSKESVGGQAGSSRQAEVKLDVVYPPAAVVLKPSTRPDWRIGKNLAETMEYILEHDRETRKDVTFIVGPEREEISAHRLILSMVSPELDFMLYEAPSVKNVKRHIHIILESVSSNVFRIFLRFIYTSKLNPEHEVEDIIDLLKLATRLSVMDLINLCFYFLKTGINDQNAAVIFNKMIPGSIHEDEIRNHAFAYVLKNGESILYTHGFLKLSLENLCTILKGNELIAQEIKVFQGAIRWAVNSIQSRQPNADLKISDMDIRNELDRALFLIRFPLLSLEHFSQHVASRDILTTEERLKLSLFIENQSTDQKKQCDVNPFSQVERDQITTVAESFSKSCKNTQDEEDEPPNKVLKIDSLDQSKDFKLNVPIQQKRESVIVRRITSSTTDF